MHAYYQCKLLLLADSKYLLASLSSFGNFDRKWKYALE